MGVGAALIMPATLSLLTNVLSDPGSEAVPSAPGPRWPEAPVPSDPCSEGSCSGTLVGIGLLDQCPCGHRGTGGRCYLLPMSRDPAAPRLDPMGAILSVTGLVALLWSIIEAPPRGANTTVVAGSSSEPSWSQALWAGMHAITRCSTCVSSRTAASRPPTPDHDVYFAMFGRCSS